MANNFIDVLSQANVIGTVFSGMTVEPLRPMYVFDAVCKARQWGDERAPVKGDVVVFPVLAALSSNTAALDPTAGTVTGSKKSVYTRRTVSLGLYGDHATIDMLQTPITSFADVLADNQFILRDQALNSRDLLARAAMDLNKYANEVSGTLSTTYHYYASNATASSMGPLRAIDIRKSVTALKGDNVRPFADGYYMAIIDPVQAQQLRAETGNANWRTPAEYNASIEVYNGEIGIFEGCRFVASTQVAGHGTNTISAYVIGADAVGKALGYDLRIGTKGAMEGPHDNLLGMYWDMLLGYKIIRRQALRIIESDNDTL